MAPREKIGNSQAHSLALQGKCTAFNAGSVPPTAPTTVPPNWLTTPYVITRTSKLTAAFGFVGPTLRIAPADADELINLNHQVPSNTYVNLATRNIFLETELFPIMRTTIAGLETFVVPFVSSNIQIKQQPKSEPGPCDSTSVGQLYDRPSLSCHNVAKFYSRTDLLLLHFSQPIKFTTLPA